ncbi:MAG: transposase [Planctomycetaceae bacterium]
MCRDMWQPYLNVIARRAGEAVHILDRFHITKNMNEAIDQVRREEVRQLKADGYEPILKHARWALLKNAVNWTHQDTVKMRELLTYNLKSVRARLMREDFQRFWEARPRRRPRREENGWGRGSPTRPAGRRSSSANGARGPCARGWNRCRTWPVRGALIRPRS